MPMLVLLIDGPDAEQALQELLANCQYDDLSVRLTRIRSKYWDMLNSELLKKIDAEILQDTTRRKGQ